MFYWKIFPICFIEGDGLTPFKKISEYIISSILLVDILLLIKFKNTFTKRIYRQLAWCMIFTICSELAFTFYISNYGFSNLVGHYFKLFSFYLIYKAIIETGIEAPFAIIFKELVDTGKQLREAKEAADAANRAKSEFLSNMSHELRTPLNGILGYAQILSWDRTLGHNQLAGLDIISRSGQHLLNLINEILDLAKIEARKLEIEAAAFPLREMLTSLIKMIEIKAWEKDIAFVAALPDDLPAAIVADQKRLSQVLINLLGNAVKFTDQGTVTFRVAVTERSISTVRLLFEVQDTGIGIPANKLDAIFAPFEQVGDGSVARQGTGLGLTISRRLVRMMGGEVHVRSTPGQGSVFRFELEFPFQERWDEEKTITRQRYSGYAGQRRNILVVDDHAENRTILRYALEVTGFEVSEAEDGMRCLELLEHSRPDLIVMDLVMPRLDGFDTIRRIRDTPAWQRIKVIAATASVNLSTRTLTQQYGFDGVLYKPLRLEELFRLIGAMLQLEWDQPLAEAAPAPSIGATNAETVPPEDIERLARLAKTGDVRGLRNALDAMLQRDPDLTAFVDVVSRHIDAFQIKELREFLAEYRESDDA